MIEIKSAVEWVTPEKAKRWLSLSVGNRKIVSTRVETYVRDMMMGRWYIAEAIKFNREGGLIDGHHRLQAVVNYGLPVEMLVTRGLPIESIKGIDLGQSRSKDQVSKFMGESFSRRHFAIARIIEYGPKSGGAVYLSYDENRELILKYLDAVNFVALEGGHERYVNVMVCAAVARAYYSCDNTRLIQFFEVLKTGMPESPKDWAAQRLRLFFTESERLGSRPKVSETYWRAESAIWHFCKGNPIKLLRPASKELFPLKLTADGKVTAE